MKHKLNYKQPESKKALTLLLCLLLLPVSGLAETAEEKGFRIAAQSDRSDRGFINSTVKLDMYLRNAVGKESTRHLNMETLEMADEDVGNKTLLIFKSPADIKGTALLSHAKILNPDDQWLFLPALKRVKRISSANKSGPFVGSEFAFEDFTAMELNKFDYKYIRTEACGDLQCDLIERYPRYENSGYQKQETWIDTKDRQVRKINFYDRRGDLLKNLTLSDYKLYNGKFWRAHELLMSNAQTGKSTKLSYSSFEFNSKLNENHFTTGRLKRIR